MTEPLFTVPDDWIRPEAPDLPAVARKPNERLIPPSIRDARSKAVLGAFIWGARQFDFRRLLGRVSSEMTIEELPLALYERSLDAYVGPDGLPEVVVRDLIDYAFVVKGLEGTDEGVLFGLSLLGLNADIRQWWQEEPPAHHDTHAITVWIDNPLYDDDEVIVSDRTIRAAETMIAGTKRHSQDTAFRLGVQFDRDATIALAGSIALAGVVTLKAVIDPGVAMTSGVALAGSIAVAGVVVVKAVIEPWADILMGADGAILMGADGAILLGEKS